MDGPGLRVLTWNLFHGRAVPGAGRALLPEFARLIAGWEWDVALLQEVPPWWPPELARAADAQERTALTSRNCLLPLRRWIAERAPDLIRSGGGGANAILARRSIGPQRVWRLRRFPERRVMHAARLEDGTLVANLHASTGARARGDVGRAVTAALSQAAGGPLVLGGDFNLTDLARTAPALGLVHAGGHHVDHVLVAGLQPAGARILEHGALSDHAPLLVELGEGSGPARRPQEKA
jgi:endonuclease/exonuclease/phosphatase family metal-dependent hydrolase